MNKVLALVVVAAMGLSSTVFAAEPSANRSTGRPKRRTGRQKGG